MKSHTANPKIPILEQGFQKCHWTRVGVLANGKGQQGASQKTPKTETLKIIVTG